MKAFYCDHFVLPLPDGHRFPMTKYRLLRERIAAEDGPAIELREPPAVADEDLLRAHDRAYVERVVHGRLDPKAIRRMGFPWSPQLVERSRRSVGGTLAACRFALGEGTAVNLAGGTHHAFGDRGEGFCVFNDGAVAVRRLQHDGTIERALIVDADVHQGDGTAAIFRDDPTVFTLSLHGRRNYPFQKEESDLDVGLDDGTGDDDYLDALEASLDRAFPLAGADLAIFLAGADPFAGDKLGRLALTKDGLDRRDVMVLDRCRREGCPVAVVMSGGYAPRVEDIVDIHHNTVRRALALHRRLSSAQESPSISPSISPSRTER